MSLTREEAKKALETLAEKASTIALELSRSTGDALHPARSDQARGLQRLGSRLAAFVERSSMTTEPYDLELLELVKQAISPVTLASLIDREDGISIEALLKDSYSELRPQFDRLLTRLNEDYVTGVDREILLQDPQPTLQFLQPVQLQTPADMELELQHVYNAVNDTAHCKLAHQRHLRQFDLRLQPLELEAFNAELIFNAHPVCSEREGVCLHETEIRVTTNSSNSENDGSETYNPCSGIVEAHGKRLNLSLVIDHTLAHEAPKLSTGSSTPSLRDLVTGNTAGQSFSSLVDKITPYDEISLAYILTKSIWQFYSTDWLNRPWTADDIHFYDSQEHLNYGRGGDIDLLQTYHPYVHVFLPQSRMEIAAMAPPGSRIDYSDEDTVWQGRSFPDVLALGVLLIEVLWKIKVLPQKDGSSVPIHGNLARYRKTALVIMTERSPDDRSPDDRRSRVEEIFGDILQKIFYNKLFQGEDQRGDEGRAIRRDILFGSILEPIRRLYDVGVKGRINRNGPLAVVRSSEYDPGKATTDFDYGTLLTEFQKGCANRKSHTKIARALTELQQFPRISNFFRKLILNAEPWEIKDPIRIAVLDTGCDLGGRFFTRNSNPGEAQRIRWHDFVTPGQAVPTDDDPGKHGTNIATLLLMLLPMCEIFVGRVATSQAQIPDSVHNIAKAITHASTEWNAHIITMSWGFSKEKGEIRDAINKAWAKRQQRILFFAAANNEGFREPELFPASHYVNVISVGGAEDDGEPAKGLCPNPKPEHDEGVFSALGVAVPCGNWEDKPAGGGIVKAPVGMSGCSFAAPVLAATAALFLHYATFAAQCRPEHEKRLQKVFEPQGMRRLFRNIGQVNRTTSVRRWFVRPEHLFSPKAVRDLDHSDLITEMISALRL